MACACKNRANAKQAAQVKPVKQVVKSRSVTPTSTPKTESAHRVTKRVIYRRSI